VMPVNGQTNGEKSHSMSNGHQKSISPKSSKSPNWYWIGKETIKQWPNLAIKKFESLLPSSKFIEQIDEETTNNNQDADIIEIRLAANATASSFSNQTKSVAANEPAALSLSYFNEDITCEHDNLAPTQNKRLICSELWAKIYKKYFSDENELPKAKKLIFTNETPECMICLVNSLFLFIQIFKSYFFKR
jgi:hypothetical protein